MKEKLSEETLEETQRLVERGEQSDCAGTSETTDTNGVTNVDQRQERSADNEIDSVPTLSEQTKAKSDFAARTQEFLFTKGKRISLLLSVCIAVIAGFVINSDRTENERQFRKYISEAELLEYDQQFEHASEAWHNAIKMATKLGDKPRFVADLHLKAASEIGCAINMSQISSIEQSFKVRNQQVLDLRTALSLYERIPHTTAEQLDTIDRLFEIASVWRHPEMPSTDSSKTGSALSLVDIGNRMLKLNSPDKALDSYRQYVFKAKDSQAVSDQAITYAHSLGHDQRDIVKRNFEVNNYAIPLFQEIIYYSHANSSQLIYLHQWLDYLYGITGRNPMDFDSRLRVADQAYAKHDYHGAIVEYLHCLGQKNDQTVRDKLIKSMQLSRAAEIPTGGDPEQIKVGDQLFIALLVKERDLKQRAFGNHSKTVLNGNIELSEEYALTGQFENAELLLKPLVNEVFAEDSWAGSGTLEPGGAYTTELHRIRKLHCPAPLALADIYAKEGKFDEAMTMYHIGQKYQNEQDHAVWDRIVDAYIKAGRYPMAREVLTHHPHVAVDSFSSSGSSSGYASGSIE
ncbi:hypothetical protein BH10CYA1_BH10CYA1_15760 [soil metagenome]